MKPAVLSPHTGMVVDAAACFAVALAALVVLLDPVPTSVSLGGGLPELLRYARLEPLALASAAVAAVLACGALAASRRAWAIAVGGLGFAVALSAYFGVNGYYGTISLELAAVSRLGQAVAAGVALGAVATRAWRHPQATPAVGLLLGALGGLLLWPALTGATVGTLPAELANALPSTWLRVDPEALRWTVLVSALLLAGVATIVAAATPAADSQRWRSAGAPVSRPGAKPRRTAVAVVVVLLLTQLAAADVLTTWTVTPRWVVVAVACALLVIVTLGCCVLMGRVDGPWSAMMLIAVTAATAAAFPLLAGLESAALGFAPPGLLAIPPLVLVGAVALGVRQHHGGFRVLNGLILLAAAPVVGLALEGADPAAAAVAQLAVLAAGAGYSLGVCLPGAGPLGTVVALTVPLTARGLAALSPGALPGSSGWSNYAVAGGDPGAVSVFPTGTGELVAVLLVGAFGAGVFVVGARSYR